MALTMMNPNHNHLPTQAYHQQQQQQQQNKTTLPSNTASTSSNMNLQSSRSRDVAKADAFANLVVFIWFSSWPLLAIPAGNGNSTPSNKSPTATFQPLHSSPLANTSYSQNNNLNHNQSQSQRRSFAEGSGSNARGRSESGNGNGIGNSSSATHQEPADHFASSVKRALEEHLSTSDNQSNGPHWSGNPESSQSSSNPQLPPSTSSASTSPELNSPDSDPLTTQRLLPHQRFKTFARDVLTTTQSSGPGMALALLFIYRLKSAHPHLKGKEGSEFRIAITALMLSNKALEDHTFTNRSWSEISGIELKDINKMEVEFWLGLGMKIHVSVEEYHQWLATLRSLEERRAHALIKRERDINKRKLAQHHAAIAALQQHQHQQQQQHHQSQSLQGSPQHPHAFPQDHGYPTPPMLPYPVYHHNQRPSSSSGLLQPSSYSLHPPQLGLRTSGLAQQPTGLSAIPNATATSPSSNFSFDAHLNAQRDDGSRSPSYVSPINTNHPQQANAGHIDLSSYQLPPFQTRPNSSSGSGLLSTSNSRFHSPEQPLSRQHLQSHQQLQTPSSDSRRPSNASSQGSTSVSSVKRAFGAMQTGSASPYHSNEEDQDSRSGSVGPPPSKRLAAGLGLLRPGRNLGGEDWEWMSSVNNTNATGGNHLGNHDGVGESSNRSSVSPTNDFRGHSRQSSFPMDGRARSSSIGQSLAQFAQGNLNQYLNSRSGGTQHHHSLSNPNPYPNPFPHPHQESLGHHQHQHPNASYPHLFHHHQQQQHSTRTPNMLVKPYTDYDLNSRPQPTELAFYQISAASSDRRVYGTQPAPPLTAWEYANSRRGSHAGIATGIQTPVSSAYIFTGQSPSFNLGNTTPMGSSFESHFPVYTPLVKAPQSSPENVRTGTRSSGGGLISNHNGSMPSSSVHHHHQQPSSQINRSNYYNHNHNVNNHQPHPLSRTTSPIARSEGNELPLESDRDQPNFGYDSSRSSIQHIPSATTNSHKRKAESDQQNHDYENGKRQDEEKRSNNHDVFGQEIYNSNPSR